MPCWCRVELRLTRVGCRAVPPAGPSVTALDRDVTALAGSTVTMACDTSGFDSGRLTWRREGGPLPTNAYYDGDTLRYGTQTHT